MSLQQWLENSWVVKVTPSAQVVKDHLAIADRELDDAAAVRSADGNFGHAYDAVRALCEAAINAAGYEVPKGGRQHERLIESLRYTLGAACPEDVDYLDRCRRQRHKVKYERTGVVSRGDADQLLDAAKCLRSAVQTWLESNHPDLI
ncbi:MAG TPA: hypothetical protein VM223_10740 [Planctomycetota bacterium]|nr:hypothetical protein [Planctomycetota bacterium]